jgi:hypothetical protein
MELGVRTFTQRCRSLHAEVICDFKSRRATQEVKDFPVGEIVVLGCDVV